MKNLILFVYILISLSSCDNNYDVVIRKSNGMAYKYQCKEGKDTLNSTIFRFYKSTLVSKTHLVDGKVEGTVFDYYPNGNIHASTNYRNGEAFGVNQVFNESGSLIRQSFYIDNKQVLFESIMKNTEKPVTRRKIISLKDNKQTWAGELFINTSDSNVNDNYHGMYVNVNVDDTVKLNNEILIRIDIILPTVVFNPKILIGDFDMNLNCIDTTYYATPDSLKNTYSFSLQPKKTGSNYIIGRLSVPDKYLKEDIYFFKGFYVKEE